MNTSHSKFPDFLIVGAAKSGTTSLHNYLSQHPQVFLPKKMKETLFWHILSNPNRTQINYLRNYVDNLEDYLKIFSEADRSQVCGEVTPSYLYYHDYVINNLKLLHPNWRDIKIIIILREPVSKVVSHYHFVTNTLGIKDNSLEHALKLEKDRLKRNDVLLDLFYIDSAKYYNQVKAYKENFNNCKVFLFDELKNDPQKLLSELCEFLEVDSDFKFERLEKKYNPSKKRMVPKNEFINFLIRTQRKFPLINKLKSKILPIEYLKRVYKEEEVSEKSKQNLKEIFREDVICLQELLEIDLKTLWGY